MTKPKSRPVVIGESNFLTGRLLLSTLQAAGLPGVVGRDGDGVLRLLQMHNPALLVLNMNLSRPSGLELLRVLQQKYAKVKILAVTAPGQAELKATASSLGVAAFFEFPFAPEELTLQIEHLLRGDE